MMKPGAHESYYQGYSGVPQSFFLNLNDLINECRRERFTTVPGVHSKVFVRNGDGRLQLLSVGTRTVLRTATFVRIDDSSYQYGSS